jgi:hypothetical protein
VAVTAGRAGLIGTLPFPLEQLVGGGREAESCEQEEPSCSGSRGAWAPTAAFCFGAAAWLGPRIIIVKGFCDVTTGQHAPR